MNLDAIAVVGAGRMGISLAECIASAGLQVVVIKATEGDLAPCKENLDASLQRRVARGKLETTERDAIASRLRWSTRLADAAGCSLVIESCLEDLAAKRRILRSLEEVISREAVLVTNTSSLKLEELATALRHPERFLGMHFFNPVTAMKLVELSRTSTTDTRSDALARRFCDRIGKTCVDVAPSPGYVVNRLLVPMLLHAMQTLESGIADPDAIDEAMKLGCGHPMGPLALADLIGLDVVLAMARTMHGEHRDARYRTPSILRRLVLSGELGRKTGRGIYDYSVRPPKLNPQLADDKSVETTPAAQAL